MSKYTCRDDNRVKGHGAKMLSLALSKLKLFWAKRNIQAYTLSDNYASINCLEKVGFSIFLKQDKKISLIYKHKGYTL